MKCANILISIFQLWKYIYKMQKQKCELSKNEQANCYRLFMMLDVDGVGEIQIDTVFFYFAKVDARMTKNYCAKLFFKAGRAFTPSVNFAQFIRIFQILKQADMSREVSSK